MLSLVPALILMLLQGPAVLEPSELVGSHGHAAKRELLASLQKVSCDPALSRIIAELFSDEALAPFQVPVERTESRRAATWIEAPLTLGIARDDFARAVRSRAGPFNS